MMATGSEKQGGVYVALTLDQRLKHYKVFCFTISAIIGDRSLAEPRLYQVWFVGNADKSRGHK